MQLQRIAQQAKRSPAMVCHNGFYLIARACVLEAYRQTRKSSAAGVDQVTAQQYAAHLADTLRDLPERRRDHRYVAPPVERVWIEKDDRKQRPIGTPCFEDKLVQRAVGMILAAICAPEFQAFAHGCRKGHSQHQALHELREQCRTLPIAWIVDADVSGFFDTLDWGHRREFIQQRVRDGGRVRLLGKGLHAGVLESGALRSPDTGTPQGGVRSPLVSNGFLHRVLDAWFVQDVQPRMKGQCLLTRFADDGIIGCALEADARRVMAVLPKRFARFRLPMPPEKTAFIAFPMPPSREPAARGTGSFDLLGLTHYWAKTRRGYWVIKRKTGGQRLRRFMRALWPWGRDHRHAPWQEQYQTLGLTRRGYDQYDGIRGNFKMLAVVFEHTERAWRSWLSRRSHKGHIRWQKFVESVHRKRPLPKPRIMHDI